MSESIPLPAVVHVPCGVCGEESSETYLPGLYRVGEQRFDLVRCTECGLAYVNPRLREDQYRALLQSSEFLSRDYGQGLLEQGYFDRRDIWLDEYDTELDRLEAQVGYVGRLLEYGCGGGFFAEAARRRGWHVRAVETSKVQADYAEAQFPLEIYRGPLVDAPFEEGSFDVAVLNESLPYCVEPRNVVQDLYFFTRPGGHLYLTVPSYLNSNMHRMLGSTQRILPRRFMGEDLWRAMKLEPDGAAGPPYQLQHFNRNSVEFLLNACGWKLDRCDASMPKPDFLFRRNRLRLRDLALKTGFQAAGLITKARLMPSARLRMLAQRPMQ